MPGFCEIAANHGYIRTLSKSRLIRLSPESIAKWECEGIFSFKFLSITNLTLGTWHSLSKANSGKQKLRNNRKFPHSNLLYRQSGIHSPCSTIKSAHLNPTILNKFPHRRFIMQKSLQANLFIAKV